MQGPGDPKFVAPTLVEAVRALANRGDRGYVFVQPDGAERFCSFGPGSHFAARVSLPTGHNFAVRSATAFRMKKIF